MVPPFLVAILEMYGIQAIHLHPKSVALLTVFAYACEAWVGIKPSVAYFCHLFALRFSGLNVTPHLWLKAEHLCYVLFPGSMIAPQNKI
jgi:hypothetical protein